MSFLRGRSGRSWLDGEEDLKREAGVISFLYSGLKLSYTDTSFSFPVIPAKNSF